MKITNYVIVRSETQEGIRKEVLKMVEKGWELYGSPFSTYNFYCQALIVEYPKEIELKSSKR